MCGNEHLHLQESEKLVEIDGAEVKIPFRKHWCEECGSEMALNEDLRFNARAMRHARKKHRGMLTGEEIRQIRKQLRLNQEQAAKLFGGGPVAFSKYENEEVSQSDAMDRLIWIVGMIPGLAQLLAKRLKIDLAMEAEVTLEKTATEFKEEYVTQARVAMEATSSYFRGFSAFSTASNEEIYKPDEKAGAVEGVAA
ncbi:MAG: hypothetical protein A3F74_24240 [Betaproteobacteria bacterium RIFCSPLOWO2_12_FULL_62_58]|nr:MAG: hypothetical protein A3F74_24240 [Betaproteobacteria bacterium RIFCSPLOWO2_12_FULL_62_58]